MKKMRIQYRAPLDLTHNDFPAHSFDAIFSNSVISFIPEPILAKIIEESKRLLRPGAVCCHNITVSDEFANTDKSITYANFLRFSPGQWRFWGQNKVLYQSRLRPTDYVRLFESAGFAIESAEIEVDQKLLSNLPALGIHADFADYPPRELAAIHFKLIARTPKA